MVNKQMRIPRIMLAAPKSGSGKTLITCALLQALKRDNKDVIAFKCGPDYIDSMFHRTVTGIPAENLDTFFTGEKDTREIFAGSAKGRDIAVMEGVMGLFDGLGGVRKEGSAYHLAEVTNTPIILVADVHGMGRSMAAMLSGFAAYDTKHLIKGILLNCISETFYKTMKPLVEEATGIPVIGFFPERKDIHIDSRHLGLCMPGEISDLQEQMDAAAEQLFVTGDFGALLNIAEEAIPIKTESEDFVYVTERSSNASFRRISKKNPVLAVARDEAFCFYYEANLRLLEELGAKIEYFSPIHDAALPENTAGLLLGGGYPELYLKELSENAAMKKAIKNALETGIPSLAECGGFMYLHDSIKYDNEEYQMAGVIPGRTVYKGKLVRFGYVEVSEKKSIFLPGGKSIKGHEFHYFDSTNNGNSCIAVKPVSGKSFECVHESADHFWGFAHLYYPSAPEFAEHFVDEMCKYRNNCDKQ